MTTQVTRRMTPATALVAAMKQAATEIVTASGNMPYLRLLQDGLWVYGSEDTEVEKGSVWACDIASFIRGFQAWSKKDGLKGEVIQLITDQPVLRSDLEDVGAEWKPVSGFNLVCISGEAEGLMVQYKTTSKGGCKEIGIFLAAVIARIESKPKDGTYIPVVSLGSDSYKHKDYGKTYTPIITIDEWTDEDELMAMESEEEPDDMLEDETEAERLAAEEEAAEAAAKAAAAAKPKRKSRAKKEEPEMEVVTPEPDEGEAEPKRRRRTRK